MADLLGAVPSAALVIDVRTAVRAANANAHALLNGAGHLSSLFTPACRAQFAAALLSASASGEAQHGLELEREDGKTWIMGSLAPCPDDGDLFVVTLSDITSLKNRLATCEASENRWHSALVGSSSGVWEYRADLDQWYCSDIWRQIRGIGPDEPIPSETDAWLERIHPEDRQRVAHCVDRQIAGDPDYMTFD
ncbi:MAG: PAS domain-containing protein, partial [Rhizobiaceae bacterium]|nr:PAS domain-containing protein [Rhizobiaceae bacterium]